MFHRSENSSHISKSNSELHEGHLSATIPRCNSQLHTRVRATNKKYIYIYLFNYDYLKNCLSVLHTVASRRHHCSLSRALPRASGGSNIIRKKAQSLNEHVKTACVSDPKRTEHLLAYIYIYKITRLYLYL